MAIVASGIHRTRTCTCNSVGIRGLRENLVLQHQLLLSNATREVAMTHRPLVLVHCRCGGALVTGGHIVKRLLEGREAQLSVNTLHVPVTVVHVQ